MSLDPQRAPSDRALRVLEERNRAFRVLYDTMIQIAASQPEDLHGVLSANLRHLCQASCAALASLDPETGRIRMESIAVDPIGADCQVESFGEVVLSTEVVEALRQEPVQEEVGCRSGFESFFPGCAAARAKCEHKGRRYRMACRREGQLLAVATVTLPEGRSLRLRDVVETYLDLAGLALHRQLTLRALSRSESKFRSLVEAASVGIAILSHGKVLYLNPHLLKLTGRAAEDLPLSVLRLVDRPEIRRVARQLRAKMSKPLLSPGYSVRLRHPREGWLDTEVTAEPIRYQGQEAQLLFVQDVTERNKLQEQLFHSSKLEAIGVLASGIAHEINTPIQYVGDNVQFAMEAFEDLNGLVRACLEMIDSLSPEGRQSEEATRIRRLCEEMDLEFLREEIPRALEQSTEGLGHVRDIVRAMRVFGHQESGEFTAADLNEIVQNSLIVSRNEWKHTAQIELDLDPDLPPIQCQAGGIQQVILNILINAAHAVADEVRGAGGEVPERGDPSGSGAPKGRIAISTRAVEMGVQVSVADTGGGIPDDIHDRIFDPFFTTKVVGKGTGQGLSLAHQIVTEGHGGILTFDTRPGDGTTFHVVLPLAPPGQMTA